MKLVVSPEMEFVDLCPLISVSRPDLIHVSPLGVALEKIT